MSSRDQVDIDSKSTGLHIERYQDNRPGPYLDLDMNDSAEEGGSERSSTSSKMMEPNRASQSGRQVE
jgi:hypothetical protein